MKIKTITVLALTLSYFSLANAGTAVSGGGGAFVCRDENKNITKSMLVDLWESQNTPFNWPMLNSKKLNIQKTNSSSIPDQIKMAVNNLSKLYPKLAKDMSSEIDEIIQNQNYLPSGITLTIPNDLKVDYFPTNCPPEGMLRYNGYSKQLDIQTELFEKLETNTDVAAAYVHEAIYKLFRESEDQAQDSTLARRLVACLFSNDCVAAALQSKNTNNGYKIISSYKCKSDRTQTEIDFHQTERFLGAKWFYQVIKAGKEVFNFDVSKTFVMNNKYHNNAPSGDDFAIDFKTDSSDASVLNPAEGWLNSFGIKVLDIKMLFFKFEPSFPDQLHTVHFQKDNLTKGSAIKSRIGNYHTELNDQYDFLTCERIPTLNN